MLYQSIEEIQARRTVVGLGRKNPKEMARLLSTSIGASNTINLHHAPPLAFVPPSNLKLKLKSRSRLRCQTDTTNPVTDENPVKPDLTTENGSQAEAVPSQFPEFPNRDINRRVALASTIGAVGLFLSSRLEFGVSLKDLAATAVPYEEALSNGKPTVVEFYADWCEVCRELAPDIYNVEQQYKNQVNFVMLNVDNTRWEQELDEFGVEGIPHFAFLDKSGNEEGNVVGRIPKQFFLENVAALAKGEETIPHSRVVGQFSSAEARKVHQVPDPRSHG